MNKTPAYPVIDFRDPEKVKNRILSVSDKNHPEWWCKIARFLTEWYSSEPVIRSQTSGSTGKPKTILLEKSRMVQSAQMTADFFRLPAGSTALLCLSPDYIAGKMMLVRAATLGWVLHLSAPSSSPLAGLPEEADLDFCAMVPMQVRHAVEHPEKLNKIRQLIIGGGAVSPTLWHRLQNIQTRCFATYGMTETITHIAVKPLNGPDACDTYTCLPGVKTWPDNRNCLIVKAPHLVADDVVTNDVVEWEDFTHFIWKGRWDNVVNSGGIKLFPEELEKPLGALLDRRYFFFGEPDETYGDQLVLLIEGPAFDPSTMVLFSSLLDDLYASHQKPKAIYFRKAFAETTSGKIRRLATYEQKA